MTELFRPPFFQPDSINGVPLAGALLYFYTAGTTTPITVYQDSSKVTPHASPVVADASGIFPAIYVDSATYKIVLQTSLGVTVKTYDNVNSTSSVTVSDGTFRIQDDGDATKQLAFQVSGLTTGTTRTLTIQDADGTIAIIDGSGTFGVSGASAGLVPFRGTSTEAGAAAGPILELYRNSVSPAAADLGGQVAYTGQNSTPIKITYADTVMRIIDPTAASEDGAVDHYAMLAGTRTKMFGVGPNLDLTIGQIKFPATANDSSDANTLDDYEEGTWTPAYSSTSATFSYASQIGHYTKIGNRVLITWRIALNTSGNILTANTLTITGLPFTNGNSVVDTTFLFWAATTSSFVTMLVLLVNATAALQVNGVTAAAVSTSIQASNTALHATNGTILSGQMHYKV